MGRCKSLGSWNYSFHMHLRYVGPVFCVFTSCISSGLYIGHGCILMASRWQVVFAFLSFLRTHWLQSLMTDIFVYWYGRKYSIFHITRQVILMPGNLSQLKKSLYIQWFLKIFKFSEISHYVTLSNLLWWEG